MAFVSHITKWRLWNDCIALNSLYHNICSLVRYLKHPLVIALNEKHHTALTYSLWEALESWQGPPSAVLQQRLVKVSAASVLSNALLCMLSHTAYGEQRELDLISAHSSHRELPEPCSHLWPPDWTRPIPIVLTENWAEEHVDEMSGMDNGWQQIDSHGGQSFLCANYKCVTFNAVSSLQVQWLVTFDRNLWSNVEINHYYIHTMKNWNPPHLYLKGKQQWHLANWHPCCNSRRWQYSRCSRFFFWKATLTHQQLSRENETTLWKILTKHVGKSNG